MMKYASATIKFILLFAFIFSLSANPSLAMSQQSNQAAGADSSRRSHCLIFRKSARLLLRPIIRNYLLPRR